MIRTILLALAAFLVIALPALADTRSVYTITDIPVDRRAPSVIEAQQLALADARRLGAEGLIAKITLPEDLAAVGGVVITNEVADRLAAAVDVQEESRGGGRYRGVLSAVLNPLTVRAFLEEQGIPYVDSQAPMAMIIPVGNGNSDFAWSAAWPERDDGELAPFITSPNVPVGPILGWQDIETDIRILGAERGIIAELRGSPGAYAVDLTLVTRAGLTAIGRTDYAATLPEAAEAAAALLSETWKRSAIIRDETRTIIAANVLYTSIVEWNTLRGALARSPLVFEFQTQAIARDGALVRFAYAGTHERLIHDLRQRGVELDTDPAGWVLTSALTIAP
ncbi:MAG: hypothetical protein MRY64_00180 [Hyphomonadaceae bacterium]|nr:hypothetical protein [Hyphomonadaceae bacterium]